MTTKKFVAVAAVAFAFAFAFTASAYDLGSTTLKRGSKGDAVMQLQKALNEKNGAALTADGSFGRGTESAVKAFQASKGLKADGLAGNGTKAALNASTTTTTTTTAGLCPNGMTLASNCTMSPSSTTVNSTAEGYMTDGSADSSNRVSTVYESEADRVVAGWRATARLSDQKIEKIQVQFKQTDTTTASANLAKYISSASIWNGSTKIATISVSDADRSNSDDTYTFNFTGLTSVVAKDTVGRFYVSVNANGSLDSNDATNAKWYVAIKEVRATSPNGVYNNYNSTLSLPVQIGTTSVGGLTFGKFSANGVKAELSLSANNPSAQTIGVSETSNTPAKTILKFKITAKNTNLTLRKIPVTLTIANNGGATLAGDVINSVKLFRDSTELDNKDGSANTYGVFSFDNLAGTSISAGQSAEFSVVVEFKKQKNGGSAAYAAGTTVTAAFSDLTTTNFSVQDSNGDQLQSGSTYRSGSAIGSAMTLRAKGVSSTIASAASSTVGYIGQTASKEVTFTFPLNLVGTGVDYYVPKAALYVSSTIMPAVSASKGIYFTVTDGAGTALSDASVVSSDITSGAQTYGSSTPVSLLATNSGVAANLVVNVKRGASSTAGFYKLVVLGYAGSESQNTAASELTAFAVDNQSAYTVTSNGTIQ